MSSNLHIFGSGFHAVSVQELALTLGYRSATLVSLIPQLHTASQMSEHVNESDRAFMTKLRPLTDEIALGLASTVSYQRNGKLYDLANSLSLSLPALIHPTAQLGRDVKVGPLSQVFEGVILKVGADVGPATVLQAGVVIEHDCVLAGGSVVAAGAVLGGRVRLGKTVYVGLGALIRDGLVIGEGSLIGMGSVVVEDLPPFVVAMGNPARIIKYRYEGVPRA